MINPYQTLNIPEDTPLEEIKKTYRDLSKKYHPDLNPGNKASEEKFKQISEAYDMINSEQKIKQYKNRGTGLHWDQDFENIFSDFFKFRQPNPINRPSYITLHVTLEDIFSGCTKDFSYRIANTCKNCGGAGGTEFNNQGRVIRVCSVCNGRGSQQEVKSTKVTIPRSSDENAQIRAADPLVIVTIKQAPHNIYQRNGSNVVSEETLPLYKVFDGSDITIRTLHGELKVSIPKFTQNGSMLRIKGKGLFDLRTNSFGDHIIKLKVQIPNNLTDDQCQKIVEVLHDQEKNNSTGS